MHELLTDLLSLSRVGSVIDPGGNVDLGELASEAVATVTGSGPGEGIEIAIDPSLPRLSGDRARLLEVMSPGFGTASNTPAYDVSADGETFFIPEPFGKTRPPVIPCRQELVRGIPVAIAGSE